MCTLNRCGLLEGCLAALTALEEPPGGLELLVVDNGSTDGTDDVVVAAGPGVRSVTEPAVGLSRARNTAAEAAHGNLLLFVDDDVRVPPTWARAHVASHDRFGPGHVVGGGVALRFETRRPAWLTPRFEAWYTGLDLGPEPRVLGPSEWLVGANFSVERDLVRAVGGFSSHLGRAGTRLLSNEDLDFFLRVRSSGRGLAYDPQAGVTHLVPAERATRRWLLRRAYAQGVSDALADEVADSGHSWGPGSPGAPGWHRRLVRVARSKSKSEALTAELVRSARRAGRARATRRTSRTDGGGPQPKNSNQ